MKVSRIIIGVAVLSAVCASCNKENLKPEGPGAGVASLVASSDDDVRTSLKEDGSVFRILWSAGDEIATVQNSSYGVYYTEKGGTSSTIFNHKSGEQLTTGGFTAYYPATVYDNGDFVWPSTQGYKENAGGPMIASGTVPGNLEETKEPVKIKFSNLGGVLRVKLNTTTTESFIIKKAFVTAATQPISGNFEIEDAEDFKKAVIDGSGSKTIEIACGSGITIDKSTEKYIDVAMPAITDKLTLTFIGNDGYRIRAKLNTGAEIQRGRVLNIPIKTDPKLASDGSNCYIVEPGTQTPIVIQTMGNAFEGSTALDGNNDKAKWVPFPKSVNGCKVVWETVNTATAPETGTIIQSATYNAGILTVVPTGTPGNALVAVTSGTDGTGDILWSYHIWVPDSSSPMTDVEVNGVTFMDRNIGALKAADPDQTDNTKSIGMFYQWGRKDPMLAFCDFNHTKVNGINDFPYISDNSETSDTRLKHAIQSPDKYIKVSNTISVVSLGKLWGYDVDSYANTKSAQYKKTIYDPCPAGYRVASHSDYCAAKGGNNNDVKPGKIANNAIYFPLNDKLCFPVIGFVDYNIAQNDQYMGVWTAVIRGINSPAWMLNITSSYIRVGQSNGAGTNGYYGGCSFNVRCVKDTYDYSK